MKISKIAMLTILMIGNATKSQEFYTCVPKKDCVSLEEIKELLETVSSKAPDIPKDGTWKEKIHLTPNSIKEEFKQTLQPGKYKVTAAAAEAKPVEREFIITKKSEFKACVGMKGGRISTVGGSRDFHETGMSGFGGGGGGSGIGYDGIYSGTIDTIDIDVSIAANPLLNTIIKGGKGGSNGGDGGCCSKDSQGKDGADGGGYGLGYNGKGGKGSKGGGEIVNRKSYGYVVQNRDWAKSGTGGSGCHSGGGGGGGAGGGWGEFFANNIVSPTGKKNDTERAIKTGFGGRGGSGGSYFEIADVKLILKGSDGDYNSDEYDYQGKDGFVKIERWE